MHINHVNQRADKFTVSDSIEGGREVERYTMRCPECGSEGVYDDRGDVVCSDESCGVLIAGPESSMVVPIDYSGSRGFGELPGSTGRGTQQPSV